MPFDFATRKEIAELAGNPANPTCLAASSESWLAAGDVNGKITLWKTP